MATTINAYSVSLALDASDYISNSSLSRSETSALKREINGARDPADKYTRSLNLLNKSLKSGAIDQKTYNRLLDSAGSKFSAASSKARTYVTSLTKMAAAYISLRVVTGVVGGMAKLAGEAEQAAVQFKVLLNDVDAAKAMLQDLKKFAAATPFQFPEIRKAAQLMLAFGFSTKEVMVELQALGNIAAGTGAPITELAELMGKARVQNTIMSEDLNQLTGRGINVLDGLAKRFGVVTDEVKKLASTGKIKFADLNAVIIELSESTPGFFGLMAEQSETLNGKMSTLKDEIAEIGTILGETMVPSMKKLADVGSGWAQSMKVGMNAISSGDFQLGETGRILSGAGFRSEDQAKAAIADDQLFMAEQIRKRRAGEATIKTQGSIDASAASDIAAAAAAGLDPTGIATALGSTLEGAFETIRSGAGGLVDLASVVSQSASGIALAGMADTQELIKATKEDPAIASLEAGTQEAYTFLTQASRDAATEAKHDAEKQATLAANAKSQREKMNEWLGKINTSLEDNGFKRIR